MTHEEEKKVRTHIENLKLDWAKAEEMKSNDIRRNTGGAGVLSLLIPDKDGNDVAYYCHKKDVPEAGRKALGIK